MLKVFVLCVETLETTLKASWSYARELELQISIPLALIRNRISVLPWFQSSYAVLVIRSEVRHRPPILPLHLLFLCFCLMMKLSVKWIAILVLFFQLGYSEPATLSANPDYGSGSDKNQKQMLDFLLEGLRKTSWPSGFDDGVGKEGSSSLFSHKRETPARKLGRIRTSLPPPAPQKNKPGYWRKVVPAPPPPTKIY